MSGSVEVFGLMETEGASQDSKVEVGMNERRKTILSARWAGAVVYVLAGFLVLGSADESFARGKGAAKKRASKAAGASAKKLSSKSRSTSAGSASPSQFVTSKAQAVLSQLKSRPLRPLGGGTPIEEVETGATKASWMKALYDRGLVEASWATEMLSDKRILAEVLRIELGTRAEIYYPKTIGLREFLQKRRLVNSTGVLTAGGDRIESALHDEFPAGFVVRPAVGVAPQETGRGLFANADEFILELLKPGNSLYSPEHLKAPVKSHILNEVASGEAVVLQESVVGVADVRKPLRHRFFHEVRVHTYEGRLVENSVPERWVQKDLLSADETKKAEAFVEDFLRSLPLAFLMHQAWGVDVAVMDNGEMRVIDVVTNRGKRVQWSSYLEQPRVIGAYSRHFENYYGIRFSGFSGSLIRNNFANYFPYWGKRIEKARPGFSKVMAFFPPVP